MIYKRLDFFRTLLEIENAYILFVTIFIGCSVYRLCFSFPLLHAFFDLIGDDDGSVAVVENDVVRVSSVCGKWKLCLEIIDLSMISWQRMVRRHLDTGRAAAHSITSHDMHCGYVILTFFIHVLLHIHHDTLFTYAFTYAVRNFSLLLLST